ncbi:MAG: helix-turn-helix domain-containing protein [Proteobacteria bacterium]|nr:helix-turn-helix domain-containing protein [Pseudomonadota bacterium]MBU1638881.1 helix-turn-helix domain-containing protein [Pseudomonadota bacterium]
MNQFSPSDKTAAMALKIGRNLRLARKRRRKTIAEAAAMVGVSVSTIKRVEAGDPSVKFGVFLALAEVFQLDTIHFAEPESDAIGLTLEKQRLPKRIRKKKNERLDF